MFGGAVLSSGGVFGVVTLMVLFVIFLIHYSKSHP
jgi:hypothetical protein